MISENSWSLMLLNKLDYSERNVFKDILFLARSGKIFSKNAFFARNISRKIFARLLQEFRNMIFLTRILRKLCL